MTNSWALSDVKNILLPTDFLENSEAAMAYAIAFADSLDATLHIVHVIDRSPHVETTRLDLEIERQKGATQEDVAEALVNDLVEKVSKSGIKAVGHWREGKVDEETLRLIDHLDIGLVVMGTHGRRKEDVVAHRSFYLRTIHEADVPVLAVKASAKTPTEGGLNLNASINRILCPCDLSEFSHAAVHVAAELCRQFKAELLLAHIVHTHEEYLALEGRGGKTGAEVDSQKVFNELLAAHGDISSSLHIVKGKPQEELIGICKEQNCDMIVMATHGHKPVVRYVVGSVMEWLVIDLCCPLVSIRPERLAERFPS
jgi:nucleotide-binding universal stress UspA family protein